MSEVDVQREEEHQHDDPESTYVPPPQKSIGELLAADQEGSIDSMNLSTFPTISHYLMTLF